MNRWQKEVQQSLLDSEAAAIKELEKQYAAALKDIDEKVKLFQADIDLLNQALSEDGLDDAARARLQSVKRSKVYQQRYQQALKGQVSSILDKMHGDNYATIDKYLNGCYETGFIGTLYDIAGQGIPIIAPIDQTAVIKAILTDSKVSNGLYNRLGVDVAKLKKTITQEISRGIASGLPYRDIARNIRNVSGAPLSRAKTIARTEGHRIQQTSTRDAQYAAKKRGADIVKQWDATLDGRTRDSHRMVDGEIRELDEEFSNGLMFPGDPSGSAAEVVNCRCTSDTRARWALDEDELQTLKERAEYFGLDKTKNFEEFRKKYLTTIENPQKSGIIDADEAILTHRKTGKNGREIINQAIYNKLTNAVIKKGGTIITATVENEWLRYLDERGATAVTIGDSIIFRPDATTTEVLEEVFHFNQNRSGINSQYSFAQRMIMNEIEAQEYLISVADKFKIPQTEREETKALLKSYIEQREKLKKAGEWDD